MLQIFLLPDKLPDQILDWYTWNLSYKVSNEQILFLKHLYVLKNGISKNCEHFIITDNINFKQLKIDHSEYDMIFIDQSNSELVDLTENTNSQSYIISKKFANLIIQLYDKPFTYLTVLDYTINLFRKHGKIGITGYTDLTETTKYKVRIVSNFNDSNTLHKFYGKALLPNSDIILTQQKADYTVIINKTSEQIDYSKSIVFQMEPNIQNWKENYDSWYVDKKNFCFYLTHDIAYNNLEWHLNKNVSELHNPIKKTKGDTLSIILSSQYESIGHKLRIDFFKYLQDNSDIKFDFYGKDNKFNFKNYVGSLPVWNKDNGLFPYKYTFNAENCSISNYFTEKLVDAILAETMIFYWGCPNISDYIDERCMIILDLNDFIGSVKLIQDAIKNDEYSKRLPFIKNEKNKIINRLQFIPRLSGLIKLSKCKIIIYKDIQSTQNNILENTGIYNFEYVDNIQYDDKNTIVLNNNIKMNKFFIDTMTMILQSNQERVLLNVEAKSSELLVDLDLKIHRLNPELIYYVSNKSNVKYNSVFASIKAGVKWKVCTIKTWE